MADDASELRRINEEIGGKEADGDSQFFLKLLASEFAFRRASGAVVDALAFLKGIGDGKPRQSAVVEPIQVFGDRAIVECVVTLGDGKDAKRYHNLRMFVRATANESWQLLGWANEEVRAPGA
jgi:hypothetical protein